MKQSNNPVSRQKDIVVQELKGEVLIYDLKINKAFCLNETSGLVWRLCDGNKSVAEISRFMSKKLKSPVTEDLVWLALNLLKEENLLDNNQEIENKFEGLSRREAIRKVGLASLVALPIISSLVAPTAAMAQSVACTACGEPCFSNGPCCPGTQCFGTFFGGFCLNSNTASCP